MNMTFDSKGYVQLPRCILTSPMFHSNDETMFFIRLYASACWKECPTELADGRSIVLARGEILMTERQLSRDSGLHRNTIRRLFERLERAGWIEFKSAPGLRSNGTVAKIKIYHGYQDVAGQDEQVSGKSGTTFETPDVAANGTLDETNIYIDEELRSKKEEDSPPPPAGGHESDPFSEPELFRGLPVDPEKTSVRKPRAKPLFTPSEIDKFFNEFASAYPSRHKDHSWPGSKKLFVAALKRNVDPKAIIAGAARYCQEVKNDGSFGTNYTKDAFNWLNEKKWEEYSGIHKFPVSEPEWKTNPRAWTNTQHPPPWPDAPWGTRAGLWMKTSKIWVKNAS